MRDRVLLLAAVVFLGILSLILLAVVIWRGVQRPQNPVPSKAVAPQASSTDPTKCQGNKQASARCFDCKKDAADTSQINILDFSCFAKHYGENVGTQ